MEKLNKSKFYTREDSLHFPDKGIYVFFEKGRPLYVGRSDRMKERLKEHGRRSSGHTSATFAFIMAKKMAEKTKIDLSQIREDLEKDPELKPIYDRMKERVSKMQIKVVEVPDPVEQTFFEVYAALELKTPYNEWGTH
ncbi:MAG: hypothetical protein WAN78_10885 [Methanoregula sp.]